MSKQEIECPRCKSEGRSRGQCGLKPRPVKGTALVIDWCPRCRGIWFDGGELERSFEEADQNLEIPPGSLAGGRSCPKGHGPMWTFLYPQTSAAIAMCGKCFGVWLEGGQFQEIREARTALTRTLKQRQEEGIRGLICDWIDEKIADLGDGW